MSKPSLPALTPHDSHVLSQIFSPSAPPPVTSYIDPTLPSPPAHLRAAEAQIIAPLNTASPSDATLQAAIAALDALIELHPYYASAYNNRAQATRLLVGDDLRVNGQVWADLSQAITLVAGLKLDSKVSRHEAGVLAKAYTQRACLVWNFAKQEQTRHDQEIKHQHSDLDRAQNKLEETRLQENVNANIPEQLRAMTWEELEEVASRDFEMGGRFGSEDAREMAVRTNVHAKLCGGIVKEAMAREIGLDGNIA